MVRSKKLLLAIAIACACGTTAQAAEIAWNPATTYTIPNDGNTYYIDFTKTLTDNFYNYGTFEIKNGGDIDSNQPLYVVNHNTLNITGGTLGNFDNSGTINLNSGLILGGSDGLYNGNVATGTINIYSGGELRIPTDSIIRNGHSPTSYDGIINLLGGTINITGGEFRNNARTPSSGTGYLNISSGTFHMNSGTFHNGYLDNGQIAQLTVTGGIFQITNGTFTNAYASAGNLTISEPAQFIWGKNASLIEGTGTSSISIFGKKVLIFGTNATNSGTTTISETDEYYVGPSATYTNDGTVNVSKNGLFSVAGRLQNNSAASVNIYGNTYSYSYIENGDGSNPGAINVYYPGNLYLLGAELRNGNASSEINIESGGSLRNYHGDVDATLGDLTISAGGSFDNVRGNNPGAYLSLSAGSNFVEDEVVYLKDTLEIDYTWTITEKAKLFGNGNKISFGPSGGILIQGSDTALLLEDVLIENISGNQVRCTDDSSTLSIDNVIWVQDSNYSFTKGTLNINGDWRVKGNNTTFAYNSDQACTLQQDTNWIFDTNVTFSYDSSGANNIVMTDATAKIHFDGATLHISQDARFKDGTFVCDNTVTLNTESGKTLYFGNNNAPENLTLDFHNLSKTNIAGSGTLTNQNV